MTKKILSICSMYPSKATGSFGEYLLSLTRELSKHGFVHIIAFPLEPKNPGGKSDIIERLKGSGAEIKVINESIWDFKNTWELIKLVREVKPALVHMHYYNVYSFFNVYAYYRRIPLVYSERLLPRGGKKLFRRFLRDAVHWIKAKLLNFGVTKIICVSDFVREEHAKHYRVSKEKLITIFNGVNLDRFKKADQESINNLKSEFGINPDTSIVTCVSVVRKGKGVEFFIKAAPHILNKVKNVKFFLVGDGPLLPDIKKMVKDLNMDDFFVFLGWRADIERILAVSNVSVVPTAKDCPEAFGFVAAESMGLGVPVVASNIGGLKSIVSDGKTGFLAMPSDPVSLSNKISDILNNEDIAREFSENGVKRANTLFSLKRMVDEHIKLYFQVLQIKERLRLNGRG